MNIEWKVSDPIKVFISSGCGEDKERYNTIRADLKNRIEKTGMATVFLFEDINYASTLPSLQFCLQKLDDSDLCIFLIDNADGIFKGVVPEIQRALSTNKKAFFIFCSETSQNKTWIQKELEGPKGRKYSNIKLFDLFPDEGYSSLMNDIARTYKDFCHKLLIHREYDTEEIKTGEFRIYAEKSFSKDILTHIDKTKIHLSKSFFNNHRDERNTSLLDGLCEQFLQVMLGERTIDHFNTSLLLSELEKQQSKEFFAIVQLRWKAITAYFADNLDDCLAYLVEAKQIAENTGIPNWIIVDLLIDLRNVSHLIAHNHSQRQIANEYQQALNESNEIFFYPVLDRFVSSFYKEIDSSNIKNTIKSPFTHSFGNNIDELSDYISSAFVIAVFNASLTQLLQVHDRLRSLSLHLCHLYDDWHFRVQALKYTALTYNRKEMRKTIQSSKEMLGKINANDATDIYEFLNCIPNSMQRFIARLAIVETLGYYFSDEEYSRIFNEIFLGIHKWLAADDVNVLIGDNIFEALQGNTSRADNNAIIDFCLLVLTPRTKRFWRDIFGLIAKMGVKNVDNDRIRKIVDKMKELVASTDRDATESLDQAIIMIRKTAKGYETELDSIVQEYWSQLYNNSYLLEVYGNQEEIGSKQIERYLSSIIEENKTQGLNGIYTQYANNSYKTIENIIKANPSSMNDELATRVFIELQTTITNEQQTLNAKMSACHLAAIIRNLHPETAVFCNSIEAMVDQTNKKVLSGKEEMFDSISDVNVEWTYILLKLSNQSALLEDVLSACIHINDADVAEKITALNSLVEYLQFIDVSSINFEIVSAYLYTCLQHCSSNNQSIRYNAIYAMIYLLIPRTVNIIAQQLLSFMDSETLSIKLLILRNIDKVQNFDKETALGIRQKARCDTNYIIRKYCINNEI